MEPAPAPAPAAPAEAKGGLLSRLSGLFTGHGHHGEAMRSPRSGDGAAASPASPGRAHGGEPKRPISVYAWGACAHGQLGLPSRSEYAAPELVPALSSLRIVRIACGAAHAVALTEDAQLSTWGSNEHGQVGHHRSKHWQGPERLEIAHEHHFVDVAAGAEFSAAVTLHGKAYAWGRNDSGQLGDGSTKEHAHPHHVRLDAPVVQMSCGDRHALALTSSGVLYGWGAPGAATPAPISALNSASVISISASGNISVALTLGGRVVTWNGSGGGQEKLAIGSLTGFASAVAAVHASGNIIAALMTNGHVAIAEAPAFVVKVLLRD